MKFRAQGDSYTITPPAIFNGIDNRKLPVEEQFTITVKGVTLSEQELLDKEAELDKGRHDPAKRIDAHSRRVRDLVKSKVQKISGFFVGDREVVDFDEWCEVADPALVRWLFVVVTSSESLSRAETVNFTQAAGSASTSAA